MTKKELLAVAKDLGIKGRHEMSAAELQAAVDAAAPMEAAMDVELDADQQALDDAVANLDQAAAEALLDFDPLQDALPVRKSKKGQNLSGNVPFKVKPYFLDLRVYDPESDEHKKAPNQVRLILKTMADKGITSPADALRGETIVKLAKKGLLRSEIPSASLFAYYRRKLEQLGVVYVGNYVPDEGEADFGEEDEE